jgi:5-methylcytosine-specific restriction endonuclease McrA
VRDPIKIKEQNQKYKQSHKLQISILGKQYHQKMKDDPEYLRKRQEYADKPKVKERHLELTRIASKKPHRKESRKIWEDQHQQELKDYKKNWDKNNQDKIQKSRQKWKEKNPEKLLESWKKYRPVFGIAWGLISWSKSVRKRHNHICQVCGKPATLARHLFFRSLYPKLQFNLNNGIPLCRNCHAEIHWPLRSM